MTPASRHYSKIPLPLADIILLLKTRGLIIQNEAEAARILSSIGYYRWSAYTMPFWMSNEGRGD